VVVKSVCATIAASTVLGSLLDIGETNYTFVLFSEVGEGFVFESVWVALYEFSTLVNHGVGDIAESSFDGIKGF
jgi:hypothetical protein